MERIEKPGETTDLLPEGLSIKWAQGGFGKNHGLSPGTQDGPKEREAGSIHEGSGVDTHGKTFERRKTTETKGKSVNGFLGSEGRGEKEKNKGKKGKNAGKKR